MPAVEHAGQDGPRGVHVRHHVHVERLPPHLVGRVDSLAGADAGVRAEQVDAPEAFLGAGDERGDG